MKKSIIALALLSLIVFPIVLVSCDIIWPIKTLNPPSWILGTWKDQTGANTYTFTSNNVLYTADGITVDYQDLNNSERYSNDGFIDSIPDGSTYVIQAKTSGITAEYRFVKTGETTLDYTAGGNTIGMTKQ